MGFTDAEIDAVTQDYFAMKTAQDIYYWPSVLLTKLLKQKEGLYREIPGSVYARLPLVYDISDGGAFGRNDSLKNTDRQLVDAARFKMKNYSSVAVLNWVSEQENSGPEAVIDLVTTKIQGAQNKISKDLGSDLYSAAGDDDIQLTGLKSLANTSTTTAYGGLTEAGVVATDGTKPWAAKVTSTSTVVDLAAIATLRSSGKVGNGDRDKPDIAVTPEDIFQKVARILQVQQRFTTSDSIELKGFTSLMVEGLTMTADDFCPANHMFALNTNYIGFGVQVNFKRLPWVSSTAPLSRTMHIIFRGNMLCNHRRAHATHTALTTS